MDAIWAISDLGTARSEKSKTQRKSAETIQKASGFQPIFFVSFYMDAGEMLKNRSGTGRSKLVKLHDYLGVLRVYSRLVQAF